MGVQSGDKQAERPSGGLPERPVEGRQIIVERGPADQGDGLAERPVMAEEGHLEALRPEGHDDARVEPGQVLRVAAERMSGQGPGRLRDRRRDQGLEPAGPGFGHGRFEGPERGLPVGGRNPAGDRRSVRPGDGGEEDARLRVVIRPPGSEREPETEARFLGFDDAGIGENDKRGRGQRLRPGERLDDDLGADAAGIAGGHPDRGDGHSPAGAAPSGSGASPTL